MFIDINHYVNIISDYFIVERFLKGLRTKIYNDRFLYKDYTIYHSDAFAIYCLYNGKVVEIKSLRQFIDIFNL